MSGRAATWRRGGALTVADWPAPEVCFYETATAAGIDQRLRALGRVRAGWDAILGYCAQAVKQSRLHSLLGFASFRHYVEERLGLPARTVEQRAALEQRIWRSRPLQEARRQGVSYEKLRWLARLSEEEIGGWIPRAKAMTCIALRRRVEGETERHMRASGRFGLSTPRRIAVVLAAAIDAVRGATGCVLPSGKCLTILAKHFLDVWSPLVKRSRTRSRKVRDRDEGYCQVPGCSHRAAHSHHVLYRSQLGGDELENQIAICGFHHLRCIHGGWLRVFGKAPDELTWILDEKEWRGQGCSRRPSTQRRCTPATLSEEGAEPTTGPMRPVRDRATIAPHWAAILRGIPVRLTAKERAAMAGAIREFFKADHERIDVLAKQAGADPSRFDREAFDAFRDGLLRHIGMEEKFLFPAVRKAGALPASELKRFRVEHAAITSLLVGTPNADLLLEIQSILTLHNRAEDGPGGLYERCDALLGSDSESVLSRIREYRGPRLRPYQDHPRVLRRAEDALRLAMGGHKARSTEEP